MAALTSHPIEIPTIVETEWSRVETLGGLMKRFNVVVTVRSI
jgi:hypothetical protein